MDHDDAAKDASKGSRSKRASRWGEIVVAAVAAVALGYNVASYDRKGPVEPGAAGSKQGHKAPAAAAAATGGGQPGQAGK
ncbi:MAG: hypothetical protein JSS14_11820 [Proteobacteria bacterium]|nr:hypothetical protein [Pseudomonadota bacterium]